MEKVNHKKIIVITLLKISIIIAIFFIINNWSNIKQSFAGEAPALQIWLSQALTLSNCVFIVFLSIMFYINTLKEHREEAKEESAQDV